MSHINKCTIVLENVDLQLLKKQKTYLLDLIEMVGENEHLTGILNTLDTIQDYAVDVVGLPENEVFGLTKD